MLREQISPHSVDGVQSVCSAFPVLLAALPHPVFRTIPNQPEANPGNVCWRLWLVEHQAGGLPGPLASCWMMTGKLGLGGYAAEPYCGGVKLLFIGDIVGQPGRRAVRDLLPKLREKHGLDVVGANGENSAGGSGITVKTAQEIFAAGVDVITSGDHHWDQKEVMELLASERRFLRPSNYPPEAPGRGSTLFQAEGRPPLGILNLQ